jgi:uncharacterized membrane protein YgdD (TMEM256/DUF423 family)
MHKTFLIAGALLAGLAVVLGAFGAHGLKRFVSPETVNTFQTGVQYQMYHAFALLVLAIVYQQFANNMMHYSGWFFLGGILLFSGSLYVPGYFESQGHNRPGRHRDYYTNWRSPFHHWLDFICIGCAKKIRFIFIAGLIFRPIQSRYYYL